jgi:hypothetical protein
MFGYPERGHVNDLIGLFCLLVVLDQKGSENIALVSL